MPLASGHVLENGHRCSDALDQVGEQTISGFAPERFGDRGPRRRNSVLGQLPLILCRPLAVPSSDRLQELHLAECSNEPIGLRLRNVQLSAYEVADRIPF
jgi:hypothetical protein